MRTVLAFATSLLCALALPASAAPKVDDFAWLAGTWSETKGAVTTRETWLPPLGGMMGGASQTYEAGKKPSVEFMRITSEEAGPTFTALLDGQPPTSFTMKAGKAGEVVFENLAHDFPQRVKYWRCGANGADLCARIEGRMDGKLQGMEWHYRHEP